VQEDNVMGEFNIPPCNRPSAFGQSVSLAISELGRILRTKGLTMVPDGSWALDEETLATPAARHLGCMPDFNAYDDGRAFPVVSADSLMGHRYAGGHIHIGYSNPAGIPPFVAARLCDMFITLPLLGWDKQRGRRALYGQAGRFRPKPYGLEYRTPSNYWIFNNYALTRISEAALSVGRLMEQGEVAVAQVYSKVPWDDLRRIINEEDVDGADALSHYLRQEGALSP
jgi:hypothetical protein